MSIRWRPIAECPKDPDNEYLLRTAREDYVGYWHPPDPAAYEREGSWMIFSGSLYSPVVAWAEIDDVIGAARSVLEDAEKSTQGYEYGRGDHEGVLRTAVALALRLLRTS